MTFIHDNRLPPPAHAHTIGLLYLIWTNIGCLFALPPGTPPSSPSPSPPNPSSSPLISPTHHHHERASLLLLRSHLPRRLHPPVDCAGSNRGLFLGLAALLASLVSLLLLHIFRQRPALQPIGLGLAYSTELALSMSAAGASLAACFRMQDMLFTKITTTGASTSQQHYSRLDTLYLLLGLSGVVTHSLVGILAGRYLARSSGAPFVMMSGFVNLIQSAIQTVFIVTALRRASYKAQHRLQKPGRQLVTFLLVANIALWLFTLFDHARLAAVQLHVLFLGGPTMSVLANITLPLASFYRFHSAVSLAIIWTQAYKVDHR